LREIEREARRARGDVEDENFNEDDYDVEVIYVGH
jgi:GTP-binding protein